MSQLYEGDSSHNAQLHAAISVADMVQPYPTSQLPSWLPPTPGRMNKVAKTDIVGASAATLVVAQCAETTEAMGAEHEHLTSVESSAMNVQSAVGAVASNSVPISLIPTSK
ncbi:hypothetical protein Tsubulata_042365 [Turnera subulata]|uniref:VAN3-binding protein-like auxin canalisation domain-containing protein n=1 Tax=Turnera subulata TaxID=218843 RepID=A0A9Q0J8R2_9ROSI|nr:hypothetical protein Tsubulata_042365 [Turnera subulata]